jgi:hypothetical protein
MIQRGDLILLDIAECGERESRSRARLAFLERGRCDRTRFFILS